jgi:hypothetical protein
MRSDIVELVPDRMVRDQLDAYCERIQQALKLLDPLSVGVLLHVHDLPATLVKAAPVAEDCGGFAVDADYACTDTQPYRSYMTGGYGTDTSGPDQPNLSDPDTGHAQ